MGQAGWLAELAVTPPQPPQTAWQQLADQQHSAWEFEAAEAERQRIRAGDYTGRSRADRRRRAEMEKAAADSRQRLQVAIHCEGQGKAMVGAWSLGATGANLDLEEQWELEEEAERCEEEARMDRWSSRDKDDY